MRSDDSWRQFSTAQLASGGTSRALASRFIRMMLPVLLLAAFAPAAQAGSTLAAQPLVDTSVAGNYSNLSSNAAFVTMGGHIYFLTGDSSSTLGHSVKLWVTDGTSGSTTLVKDLGVYGSISGGLFASSTKLFFIVNSSPSVAYVSDGTTAGTGTIPGGGSKPQGNAMVGNDFYFTADTSGSNTYQMYRYSGSGNATQISTFPLPTNTVFGSVIPVNNTYLYLIAPATSGANSEIHKYDPVAGTFTKLSNYNTINLQINNIFGSKMLIEYPDTDTFNHFFMANLDATGTVNLTPTNTAVSGSGLVVPIGSNYYFLLNDTVVSPTRGNQLYKSDGTTAKGATAITDRDGSTAASFVGNNFAAFGTNLVIAAQFAGSTGSEPAMLDTTNSNYPVTLIKDLNPGANNSSPNNFLVQGSKFFFNATIATSNTALFQSDGTTAGTVQIADINPNGSDAPNGNSLIGNFLYFRAQTSSSAGIGTNQRVPMNLITVATSQGDGQTVGINSAAATALKVNVKDTTGTNNLSGVSVTFVPPASGAGGSFSSSATVVTDASGNATAPTFTANGTAGSYTVGVQLSGVDTGLAFSLTNSAVTTPTVASISSTKADGSYNATVLIPITVTFSAAVTVTGTPTLALNSGGSASYASGSGSNTLTFNYTVGATDNATDLDCSSTSSLALAGGTITATTGGSAATLTLPTPGGANSLGVNKAIVIDTSAPTITSIVRLTPAGQITAGNVVTFRVTYSEAVTVPGVGNFSVVAVNGSNIVGTVTGVTGTGSTRDVTVSITSGTGEFRLRGVN